MTHTEHVHILFGIGLVLTGVSWLGAELPGAKRLRYVWPAWLFAVGFFLVIATETQERTYAQVGAWDTFLSVFPNSLTVWLTTVQKFHVIQHKIAGVCAMAAGAMEESRACGWLPEERWPYVLPALTMTAGLALGIHGGTHQHLPHMVERAHHWVLGTTLVLGGAVHAAAISQRHRHLYLLCVLPSLVLLAGLDLALLYRLH